MPIIIAVTSLIPWNMPFSGSCEAAGNFCASFKMTSTLEDENLRLSIGAATKGRDIRSLFLENAVKYQILVYLLYHQQFLAHQLAQELMISEATLGRHLASLNQIL